VIPAFFFGNKGLFSHLAIKNGLLHVKIEALLAGYSNMTDEAREIINSPYGLNLAYFVARKVPERQGRRFATFVADFISARKSWKMVMAARCNQWVAHDEKLEGHALDQVVRETFRSIADSIFDLYHYFGDTPAIMRQIEPHPIALELIHRPEFSKRGLVIAGIHLSNFDMVFQMGGLAGMRALALTLPELSAGYRKQLEMRVKNSLHILQATVGNIKYAVDYLKAGGLLITGIDRPDNSYIYRPKFFGRPAAVPIHHVFLALKANVPVVVAATVKNADGKYHFMFSDPIEMEPNPDRKTEILLNAERVLMIAEKYIRIDPCQWSMTFPVWPEAMVELKNSRK
jgi:lauroyl/myristoyl acyltransferase